MFDFNGDGKVDSQEMLTGMYIMDQGNKDSGGSGGGGGNNGNKGGCGCLSVIAVLLIFLVFVQACAS
jgi:hypothetical protein